MTTVTPQKPLAVPVTTPDYVLEERFAARLLDVLIRAGLLLVLAVLVYRVFSPFLTLTVWGLILAVTLYPLNRLIARHINGRQGIAATLLVLLCIGLFGLANSCVDEFAGRYDPGSHHPGAGQHHRNPCTT